MTGNKYNTKQPGDLGLFWCYLDCPVPEEWEPVNLRLGQTSVILYTIKQLQLSVPLFSHRRMSIMALLITVLFTEILFWRVI